MSNIVSISGQTRENEGRFMLNHSAVVVVEDYSPDNLTQLCSLLSQKAGYHPAGYGLYGSKAVATGNPNEYLFTWTTGNSCD